MVVKVNLHGPNGMRLLETKSKPEPKKDDATAVHRRSCFSNIKHIVSDTDTEHLWDCIKRVHGIQSRTELSPEQWAKLAARIQASVTSKQVRQDFLQSVGYRGDR